jgi:predicted nucleic acid-binding protein
MTKRITQPLHRTATAAGEGHPRSWRSRSVVDVVETPALLEYAKSLVVLGLRSKDALHVASAVEASCDYFVTTDDGVLRKLAQQSRIIVVDPTTFVRSTEP